MAVAQPPRQLMHGVMHAGRTLQYQQPAADQVITYMRLSRVCAGAGSRLRLALICELNRLAGDIGFG